MSTLPLCGTVTPTTDVVLDAVCEAKGRCAIRPAETVEEAVREVEVFLVVSEWYAGELAALKTRIAACTKETGYVAVSSKRDAS